MILAMLKPTQLSALAGSILALLPSLISASAIAYPTYPTTPANLSAIDIQRQLGPKLCKGASIFAQDDPRWANATSRWQAYKPPHVQVVVQPADEKDISEIVKYANSKSLPFLTVNRAHGSTVSLGDFTGIQISMSPLQKITLNEGKQTALLQGGVWDEQVINYLWPLGYVTNTGSCGCVSMMGPGLGGGHGRWQGFYGMISDSFVKLNVVLADGSAITVSDDENKELFWAMKAAGHNFGIVTSFETKIHPRPVDSIYSKIYIFTEDKLENLTELINEMNNNGTQPKELANLGQISLNTSISDVPIVQWAFEYIGSAEDAAPHLQPFDDLDPIFMSEGSYEYPEIPYVEGTGATQPICSHGLQRMQFPAGLQYYNATAQRAIYELYKKKVNERPEIAATSFLVFEGYSVEGVRAVDPTTSAYSQRDEYLLVDINISYAPDSSLDEWAIDWGHQTQALFNEGQPGRKPTIYVNYAFGDESRDQMYGYEQLPRLQELKKKYDPNGRFNYYNPIY